MDNTLFDLFEAQVAACQAVVQLVGNDDGNELVSYFLSPAHGYESHENIRQYMNERGIFVDELFKKACREYETKKLQNIVPYEGVAETLQLLRSQGYNMGIVTDAHSRDATMRLIKTGLLEFFCCMVSYDMVKVKKPDPAPFQFALEMLMASPEETIFVGDSPRRDIEPCRNLGIQTVYARYGDRFSKDRTSIIADYCIDSLRDLPEIISRSERQT
jgi:putative hydrolase of the HAD superfamily